MAAKVEAPYCWKLKGNDHDSLCSLLNIKEEQMSAILQLCQYHLA